VWSRSCTKWYSANGRRNGRAGERANERVNERLEVHDGLQVVDHELTTTGSPADVYALLIDGSTWPEWSPIGSFELEKPGAARRKASAQCGCFCTGRIRSRELVVAAQPNQLFSYVLVSGLAIRDYRAVVTILPRDGGSVIHWAIYLQGQDPGHRLESTSASSAPSSAEP